MIFNDSKGNSFGMFLSMEEIKQYEKNYKVGNRGGFNVSRYEAIKKTNRKDSIQDIYGNALGNFFLCISIENYNAKIEICGDVSCGVPSIFDALYSISKKSDFDDKEKLIELLNAVWEEKEKDDNKFDDN